MTLLLRLCFGCRRVALLGSLVHLTLRVRELVHMALQNLRLFLQASNVAAERIVIGATRTYLATRERFWDEGLSKRTRVSSAAARVSFKSWMSVSLRLRASTNSFTVDVLSHCNPLPISS